MLELLEMYLVKILFGLIIGFGGSYLAQRGSNEAMKRDIGKLTGKVEEVKSLFNLKFHTQSNLWNEQRNALTNFYNEYSIWRRDLQSVAVNMILDVKTESIEYSVYSHLKKLEIIKSSSLPTYYTVLLFIDDTEIINLSTDMKEEIKVIHNHIFKKLGAFESNAEENQLLKNIKELELPEKEKQSDHECGRLLGVYVTAVRNYLKDSS